MLGDSVAETAWLANIVEPENRALPSLDVAYADLRRTDLADLLTRHAAYPSVRGIRQEAWFDPQSTRTDMQG